MSEEIAKKKRFAGLGHFQDPLRQNLICLQASLGPRFMSEGTALERLNKEDDPAPYLFLSSSEDTPHDGKQGPKDLLCHLIPLESEAPPKNWEDPHAAQITAWVDASDSMASSCLRQLMSLAAKSPTEFDLGEIFAWGGIRTDKPSAKSLLEFLQQGLASFRFCQRRLELFKAFIQKAEPLFQRLENVSMHSDGLSIGLLVEGQAHGAWKEVATQALERLTQSEHSLTSINFQANGQLQCMLLTPLRLPLASRAMSKGIILCRDIRRQKQARRTMRAS